MPKELSLWQGDIWKLISEKPELVTALQVGNLSNHYIMTFIQDENRVWNTDETSVELGVAKKCILVTSFRD